MRSHVRDATAFLYGSLRGNCRDQQSYVHPWCDGGHGPGSCQRNVTRDLRVSLVNDQGKLSVDQDRRRVLDDKRSRAGDDTERATLTSELEALDKEIEATKKRIEHVERELASRKYLVENTMATINKCIDYRRAVMNVFPYATDQMRSENDPDIRPLADMLRSKYAKKIEGHVQAIKDKTDAYNICRDELP